MMMFEELKAYITYLPAFKVVVCQFCWNCIPPSNVLHHYETNHTASKEHPIPMPVRRQVMEYMSGLDLCQPKEVVSPLEWIPQLKLIKDGQVCKFPNCGACRTSEDSMVTHYYKHQKRIPKGFTNWQRTGIQTFFDGQNRK